MFKSTTLSLILLLGLLGCSNRDPITSDSGVSDGPGLDLALDTTATDAASDITATDAASDMSPADTGADASSCSLSIVGTAGFGQISEYNFGGSVAHAGGEFGAVWVSKPMFPGAGTLKFSAVSYQGVPTSPTGTQLSTDILDTPPPQLAADSAGLYGVAAATASETRMIRFDAAGSISSSATVPVTLSATNLALTAKDQTFYMAYVPDSPAGAELKVMPFAGGVAGSPMTVATGPFLQYVWAAENQSGISVAHLSELITVAVPGLTVSDKDTMPVGPGGPGFAVNGAGHAVVYANTPATLVGQLIDATGTLVGTPTAVADTNIGAQLKQQVFLKKLGSNYVVAFPSLTQIAKVLLLDANLSPIGNPVELPPCGGSFTTVPESLSVGGGHVAVAYGSQFSGPPGAFMCITTLTCN